MRTLLAVDPDLRRVRCCTVCANAWSVLRAGAAVVCTARPQAEDEDEELRDPAARAQVKCKIFLGCDARGVGVGAGDEGREGTSRLLTPSLPRVRCAWGLGWEWRRGQGGD